MNERFSSDIHGLFCLIPAVIVNDEDPGLAIWYIGNKNFPSINLSLMRWKDGNGQTKQIQGDIPNNLLQSLAVCDKDSFHTLLVIACTLPITSAEAERSFSLMRRLKTALRSTMAEEHLSDLAVIAIHYGEKLLQMIYAGHLYRLTQEDFLVLLCLINPLTGMSGISRQQRMCRQKNRNLIFIARFS